MTKCIAVIEVAKNPWALDYLPPPDEGFAWKRHSPNSLVFCQVSIEDDLAELSSLESSTES